MDSLERDGWIVTKRIARATWTRWNVLAGADAESSSALGEKRERERKGGDNRETTVSSSLILYIFVILLLRNGMEWKKV